MRNRCSRLFRSGAAAVVFGFACWVSNAGAAEAFRTWTNADGKTIKAQYLSAAGDTVEIRLRTGKNFQIPLSSLSSSDREYVAKCRAANDPLSGLGENDLGRSILAPAAWSGGDLPGKWREVSNTAGEIIRELSGETSVFGKAPESTLSHWREGALAQLVCVFLEEGNFVGYRGDGAVTPETEGKDGGSVAERKEVFDARFKELENELSGLLARVSGEDGKRVSVGRGDLRKPVLQFASGELVFNLDLQEGHLIALTVQRAEDFNRRMLVTDGSLGGRKTEVRENVEIAENGDRIIRNVPMIEQGDRGYCAMGTLSMILRYYGLNLDVDALAAAAGYSEGAPQGGLTQIYAEAAELGRLRYKESNEFDFREVKRCVDRGQPVLVWRWFSRDRDAFHTEFAKKFEEDSSATLPGPDDEDQPRLPIRSDGGHASLVTGYNDEREEIFFTESWLNNYRHRRMPIDELENTAYVVFFFNP